MGAYEFFDGPDRPLPDKPVPPVFRESFRHVDKEGNQRWFDADKVYHRLDGPALICADKKYRDHYAVNGQWLGKAEFERHPLVQAYARAKEEQAQRDAAEEAKRLASEQARLKPEFDEAGNVIKAGVIKAPRLRFPKP